jgi:hypothetical protein
MAIDKSTLDRLRELLAAMRAWHGILMFKT